MRRVGSKVNLEEEIAPSEQQQPPPSGIGENSSSMKQKLLQSPNNHVFCTVRPAWNWIMEEVIQGVNSDRKQQKQAQMTLIDNYHELPSGKLSSVSSSVAAATSASRRTSTRRSKSTAAFQHTLRIDIVTNHQDYQKSSTLHDLTTTSNSRSWSLLSFHGTSEAFDGLEGKKNTSTHILFLLRKQTIKVTFSISNTIVTCAPILLLWSVGFIPFLQTRMNLFGLYNDVVVNIWNFHLHLF
jgi:hypothetical protein